MTESNWNIAHASIVGTSHTQRGTGCQDRYLFDRVRTHNNEALLVVLSDGAGSSEISQIGAELVCSIFLREASSLILEGEDVAFFDRNFGVLCVENFRQDIQELATENGTAPRDYACTFLAAIVWTESAVFYQVGDGGIAYSLTGEESSYCFGIQPPVKEYANTTDFITEEAGRDKLLYENINEPIKELIMFTDGIERIAIDFQANLPYEPFLIPMLMPLRDENFKAELLNTKLSTFLNSSRINEKTDDDKTIFLAYRRDFKSVEADRPDPAGECSEIGEPSETQNSHESIDS